MDNYAQTFETWNKMADLYHQKFMDLTIYNESYDEFCDLVADNARILEIGCGPGNIAHYLLKHNPHFQLKGLDVAEKMVELARKNNPSAVFEVMDIRQLDQLNEIFDGIVCGFCIPYVSKEECAKLIVDCANLLSEDGILYLSFVEGSEDQSGFKTNNTGDSVYFYFHDLEIIQEQLRKNQFSVKHLIHVDYPKPDGTGDVHTIVIAQKTSSNHSTQ